jgi:hypothetical protein
MSKLQQTREEIRRELESPPALRVFGSGWWSGALGIILGVTAFFGVLCVWFPGVFSINELKTMHQTGWYHPVLIAMIAIAFFLFIDQSNFAPFESPWNDWFGVHLASADTCGQWNETGRIRFIALLFWLRLFYPSLVAHWFGVYSVRILFSAPQ